MKYLIYSINYAPELTGIGKYNGEFAQYLSSKHIDVNVLTAQPYYPEWSLHDDYENNWATEVVGNISVFRCPLYIPKKLTTFKRIIHLFSFAFSSALRLFSLFRLKPDVIFIVQPTLFCVPAALIYSKLVGAKSVLHIQDYEIDAMFGLKMGTGGFLNRIACKVESWLMKRFTKVSSISNAMLEKAKHKGVESNRLVYFPNWTDINFVSPEKVSTTYKARLGFEPMDKIILYSGNLGLKQGLDIILEAAKEISANSVKFLIVGSGAYELELKQNANKMGLSNVIFLPIQPWEDMPYLLTMADIHLVVQKKGAADSVLPSKLINILSAGGHAIITAEENTELANISKANPGIYHCIDPEEPCLLIQTIEALLNVDTQKCNEIARHYAEVNFGQQHIIDNFIATIQ
ncbi:WcaI family glycosyltransferase [Thalassotalea atypica]|uniref:WcaI family glycosyltransferase n=1 Tax=Thalassotalea atypica TaxID=2054316 RepID=UPI002572A8B5|nr:WcaI family glycosyltransferase [Thalassotalea atypica]